MRARYLLAIVAVMSLSAGVALAGYRSEGAGGCGNFDVVLQAAQPGDVLAPMRSSGLINSTGQIISRTIVIQGGWDPATGDCNDAGTNQFADAAAMIAAGFSYDPNQRTAVFGDSTSSALPLDLTAGQTLVLQNLDLSSGFASSAGYAISGTLDNGARLRLEHMHFNANQAQANAIGGAVSLELRGGSQLVIADSSFTNNDAISGGALEVRLFDSSSLLIESSSFDANAAFTGNGGALRVVIDSGAVTLRGNTFTNNTASSGSGGAIAIERAPSASGPAVWSAQGNSFSGNTASGAGTADIFATADQLTAGVYLPLIQRSGPSSPRVSISAITLDEDTYKVAFSASGFTPALPGQHIHFFFNTVPFEQAGMPGSSSNWKIYGSTAPFTGYGIADRPAGATQLCALVANPDHTVIQGTGGCADLP